MQENSTFITMKNWSDDDQPREKLAQKGKLALSDAELIAILIRSGSKNETALDLAKRILASVNNNLNELGKLSLQQLMQFKGIGEAKAITVIAALEIGRRRRGEESQKIIKITSSKDVFELLHPIIGDLSHEEFWVVYLNNSNKVIHKTQQSKGGITGTMVDVRLVIKEALAYGAIGIILVHNHPSGTLQLSDADKHITKKIQLAAEVLDIKVLDHVIITQKAYFSLADNNLL